MVLGSARGQGEREEGRGKCIVKEGQVSLQGCGVYCQSGQHRVHDQAKDFHAPVQTNNMPVALMHSVYIVCPGELGKTLEAFISCGF